MNLDEKIARQHLEHLSFSDIVYEPDGNIPPDYLVDGKIAIEVRRLNQHIKTESRAIGLEEEAIPFADGIQKIIDSITIPEQSTWFVHLSFQRPIPRLATIRDDVVQACMDAAKDSDRHQVGRLPPNINLRFTKASSFLGSSFALGSISDHDEGGLVYDLLARNIDHCILDKTKKTEKHKSRYEKWWLILVDHIDYCLSTDELAALKASRQRMPGWEKILLVSAIDPTRSFEL